uniref:Uncharacterized protein n=1 Tax=Rhizophora mucronata TaxID=61149 RepID=A0A2P2JND3_RHIMU
MQQVTKSRIILSSVRIPPDIMLKSNKYELQSCKTEELKENEIFSSN